MPIRVLIVDDSALMRKLLQGRLASEGDIEVVGCACDAQEARALMKALDPDVVTLDIEMPGMDGLSFLQKIMELRPTPVIIVSGSTQEGNSTTAQALQFGAVSCYAKSDRHGSLPLEDGGKLADLVREAAKVTLKPQRGAADRSPIEAPARPGSPPELIAIGSSTGGVEALRTLLAGFPADCPPTVIVQHVNARFAPAIAQSLDAACEARVVLAQSDTIIEPGHVYFAPGGDRHLLVAPAGSKGFRTILRAGDPVSGHRPSVDVLFASVAETLGTKAMGVLLTGMGQDGAQGLAKMAARGSFTIAQDEASCVVFGMPRAAIELGAASAVLPLTRIANYLFVQAECA
ncbi:protein-glutamate methylesterase/protein-glutamine glutaminase [Alteraurantiacibacter aquimixticola]|uniref:Protein-glutamate methylesterase/protein-glutamine glutaminase n=1 Tax=Alteraurantiacibacter aquimixticola TaxID=2489173 RepID=A0A4T3F363_9SPHN|nr:chemotaxis response regulator protein-glutamate methylesterase [Alteraurantiacibacter aquimixticola]TIX49070.1 chemotaxis response regulator protein-glutamate methylesterase [Alteraurantiacibacter aquimixticola]